MNYLYEVIAFEQWLETHYLPNSSQLLWYKLMSICNKAGWCEWVTVDNLRLMAAMQMGREATVIKARDELIKAGLVDYQKGKKGSPNRYKIHSFTCKRVVQNEVEAVAQPVVKKVVQNEVEAVVQSADIYKLKQNKNKKDTNVSKENFTPPTADEVASYCQERKNRVDAKRFVDFYTAKNWMIGKNKMKDWKAAVRTWERREDGSKFNNGEQRDYDFEALEGEILSN